MIIKLDKGDKEKCKEMYLKVSRAWIKHRSSKPIETIPFTSGEYTLLLVLLKNLSDD